MYLNVLAAVAVLVSVFLVVGIFVAVSVFESDGCAHLGMVVR